MAVIARRCERADLLDLPVPLRPTSAYRWPSFKRSLALDRISIPSALVLDLALPVLSFGRGLAEATVMLTPSISSWLVLAHIAVQQIQPASYLAIVGGINVKASLLGGAENGRNGLCAHGSHCPGVSVGANPSYGL